MKGKRYTEQQILDILGQVEAGGAISEVARTHGLAVTTLYRWKARYGGMTKDETKRFRLLEEENRRLKKLVADLSLDNQMLKDVVDRVFGESRQVAAYAGQSGALCWSYAASKNGVIRHPGMALSSTLPPSGRAAPIMKG